MGDAFGLGVIGPEGIGLANGIVGMGDEFAGPGIKGPGGAGWPGTNVDPGGGGIITLPVPGDTTGGGMTGLYTPGPVTIGPKPGAAWGWQTPPYCGITSRYMRPGRTESQMFT